MRTVQLAGSGVSLSIALSRDDSEQHAERNGCTHQGPHQRIALGQCLPSPPGETHSLHPPAVSSVLCLSLGESNTHHGAPQMATFIHTTSSSLPFFVLCLELKLS